MLKKYKFITLISNANIETIQSGPTTINIEDLQDFYTLCQHFATKTPQSFRKVSFLNNYY